MTQVDKTDMRYSHVLRRWSGVVERLQAETVQQRYNMQRTISLPTGSSVHSTRSEPTVGNLYNRTWRITERA